MGFKLAAGADCRASARRVFKFTHLLLFIPCPPPCCLSLHYTALIDYFGMHASAVADIRSTYGTAFLGLLVSAVCVFYLSGRSPC